ncbi:hypothetical protein EIP86_005521 [Pleurotus ostreatoroseus]|nr:hypothetical protein EIP86_005521 [Pleurotus ostreatoroseus]
MNNRAPVIVTNLHEGVVFQYSPAEAVQLYQRLISTERIVLELRMVAAGYLHDALQMSGYIPIIGERGLSEDEVPMRGPPKNPEAPLLPDTEVLEKLKRHSDFDLVTLQRDKHYALQFLRWKEHVRAAESKLIAHPLDVIKAETNRLIHDLPTLKPCIPLDVSELSPDTLAHVTSVQRPCPLSSSGLRERFHQSHHFTLEILEVVTEGSSLGICTVYKCRVTSVDGSDVDDGPVLCLKLFDDRFQPMSPPDENTENDELPPHWLVELAVAEWEARQEHTAYMQLEQFQGSIFPWYYGAHMFTLPNGLRVYGILLEYIVGCSLVSEDVRKLSPADQIEVVLDVADIAQHDWHSGQILVHKAHNGTVHAVLVDLASITQTLDPDSFNTPTNFQGVLHTLRNSAINLQLVAEHFGMPDPWDGIRTAMYIPPEIPRPKDVKRYTFAAPDPFGFKSYFAGGGK